MAPETDDEQARLSPDDAFSLLGNQTRFEIIRTLWERYEPDEPANVVKFADLYDSDNAVTFSDLHDAVGYGDTGNFNYHLEQLTNHFVRRTDEGYELTEAGFEIARAVVAGTVRERPRIDSVAIDALCPRCDGPVVMDYEDHYVHASCSRCLGIWQNERRDEGVLFTLSLPPSGLSSRTPEEIFHVTLAYNLNRIRSFIDGVCPNCASAVDESIDVCPAHERHEPTVGGGCPQCNRQHQIEVAEICHQCKAVARGPLTIAILAHPVVTSFYLNRGVNHQFASWETFRRAQTVEEAILETNPLCIRLTVPCEGDALRLTLDEMLSVVDSEIESGTGADSETEAGTEL